jgi:diadenylate cyclase
MIDPQNFISNIRWQDVVDILFISYILFRLYVLFRGTNVFRVLIGIVLLWFFQKIAFYFGLIVTSWAVQGFTAVAAIIIIVIFRNEIRSVLQTKNFRNLLWGASREIIETPVDVIADTAFELTKMGMGALIVIPGKEDISDTVHSGIPWNGLISKEMLMSIFWKDNPVHDGAAVIYGNQIMQVGTILPLSRRKDLPSYYGTRHRAGAGLAEITDALVIIVSEERNNILCAKGNLIRIVRTKSDLVEMVNDHLGISRDQSRVLNREKFKLITAAILSLLFITGIWLGFTRGVDTLITLEAPVEYVTRNQEIKIIDTSVKSVYLDLSGSGTLLKNIVPGQVKVTIDLSEGRIGKNSINISNEDIFSLPPGVFLRSSKPSSVDVVLDKFIKKRLPIQVNWAGKLSEGLSITKVNISPQEVTVMGPSMSLDDISTIYTEKIQLNNIKESGKMNVTLNLGSNTFMLENNQNGKVTLEYKVVNQEPVL